MQCSFCDVLKCLQFEIHNYHSTTYMHIEVCRSKSSLLIVISVTYHAINNFLLVAEVKTWVEITPAKRVKTLNYHLFLIGHSTNYGDIFTRPSLPSSTTTCHVGCRRSLNSKYIKLWLIPVHKSCMCFRNRIVELSSTCLVFGIWIFIATYTNE